MTRNKCIVWNCPARPIIWNDNWCNKEQQFCQNCIDCLIKQVIRKCKYYQNKIGRTPQYRAGFVDATRDILQLFDIEEVNK